MQTELTRRDDAEPIVIQCPCGKRLRATRQHAGKRLKCPACGQPSVVPQATRPVDPALPQPDQEGAGAGRGLLAWLWGGVALVALICGLLLKWHSASLQEARVSAADHEIAEAVADSEAWLAGQNTGELAEIERRLVKAIGNADATTQADGQAALNRLQDRRERLAEQARIAEAQRKADSAFSEAKREIEAKRIPEAIALLRKYVADPHATLKDEARRLSNQAELASSDTLVLEALVALSDVAFERVGRTCRLEDAKVTDQKLSEVRAEVVKRNLDEARRRRDEIRVAAEARAEAQRREEEAKLQAEAVRLRERMKDEISAARRNRERQGKTDFDFRKSEFAKKQIYADVETAIVGSGPERLDALKRVHGWSTVNELGNLWLKDQLDATTIRHVLAKPIDVKDPTLINQIRWSRLEACHAFVKELGNCECSEARLSCNWIFAEAMIRLEEDKALRTIGAATVGR